MLFSIAGRAISPYDLLPPTYAVLALNKILTLGPGLGDLAYELTALIVLSALYFAFGGLVVPQAAAAFRLKPSRWFSGLLKR